MRGAHTVPLPDLVQNLEKKGMFLGVECETKICYVLDGLDNSTAVKVGRLVVDAHVRRWMADDLVPGKAGGNVGTSMWQNGRERIVLKQSIITSI